MKTWLTSHQQLLSQQYSHATLPHAILISGISGAGKVELAQWLINILSCQQPVEAQSKNSHQVLRHCGHCKSCLLLKSNTFPDHLNLIAEKTNLGVDDIRFANSFLQKTAHLGKYKTMLINHAQSMTPSAANALLKTLEEPSEHSIIILITNDIAMLLPTIVSRCRVLNIRPDIGAALLNELAEQVVAQNKDSAFINLTQLPELCDKSIHDAFVEFKQCYINYLTNQQEEESLLLTLLLSNKHTLRWLEQITANLLREQFLEKNTNNTSGKVDPMLPISASLLNQVYKVIMDKCKIIKTYVQSNRQFVCEQLVMEIGAVVEQNQTNIKIKSTGEQV